MPNDVTSRMAVFLFTDIVDSTAIQNRIGTDAYLRLLVRHDAIHEQSVVVENHGRIVERTGDGFLSELPSPSDAVKAALSFQRRMGSEDWGAERLRSRCAIHLGELTEVADAHTGKLRHGGMAINFAARLMDLGQGGQILMGRAVFDDARRNVKAHPDIGRDAGDLPLRWEAHGRYLFKGADEPSEVFEVGVPGISPLSAPSDSAKARRYLDAEEEQTLGWRPAGGLEVPRRSDWVLQDKIGEGGFGEVWLAEHRRMRERRVFKFCFDADRLRSFRREVTLFRLLRDTLGQRDDIASLHDMQVDKPPFFLESKYYPEGNLADWAGRQGGLGTVPLETRLDLLARIARAAGAAHSVGVIHKDIKPSNVLIEMQGGRPQPMLADFGIGELADRSKLRGLDITAAGFTATLPEAHLASRTGTRLYSAPEYLSGGAATVQGDIYALGVMLYQMVIGEFQKPLGAGWERDVADGLLRADIAAAVDVDPSRRFSTAGQLADRIQSLAARGAELEALERAERSRRRRRVGFRLSAAAGIAAMILLVIVSVAYRREIGLHRQIATALLQTRAAQEQSARAWSRNETVDAQRELDDNHFDLATARLVHAIRLDPGNARANSTLRRMLDQEAPGKIPLRIQSDVLGNSARRFLGSPDGHRLVALAYDGAKVFDWQTGKPIGPRVGFPSRIYSDGYTSRSGIRVGPDGSRILAWTLDSDLPFTLWSITPGAVLTNTLPIRGPIDAADLSPDGRRIAVSQQGNARLWDIESGGFVGRPMPLGDRIHALAFGTDGRWLASASKGMARLWDAATGEPSGKPLPADAMIAAVLPAPGGKHVFVSMMNGEGRLYSVATAQPIGPAFPVGSIVSGPPPRFSPDGNMIAVRDSDRSVVLIRCASATRVREPLSHQGVVTDIAFAADGKWLVTASDDRSARVWSTDDGHLVGAPLPHPMAPASVAFGGDGRTVLTACADGAIREWAFPRDGAGGPRILRHESTVGHAEFSPDGERVLTMEYGRFHVWEWKRGLDRVVDGDPAASFQGVRFSHDGRRVLAWTLGTTARLWDAETLLPASPPMSHPDWMQSAGFSRDGRWVFTHAIGDPEVRLWDASTGQRSPVSLRHSGGVEGVEFSPDGKTILTAASGKLRLSDPATGARISPMIDGMPYRNHGAICRDGKRMVINLAFQARVLAIPSGDVIGTFGPMSPPGFSLATLGPDGRLLATATEGQIVELWEVDTGRRVGPEMIHAGKITGLVFSPNGSWLATACDDGRVRVWDSTTGELFGRPFEHDGQVESVAFSPDGRWILSGSMDGTARIWPAPADSRTCSAVMLEFATRIAGVEIDATTGLPKRPSGSAGPSIEALAGSLGALQQTATAEEMATIRRVLDASAK